MIQQSSGYLSKRDETYLQEISAPHVSHMLFTIAKVRKGVNLSSSTDEWVKKMWRIYIQWDIIQL